MKKFSYEILCPIFRKFSFYKKEKLSYDFRFALVLSQECV